MYEISKHAMERYAERIMDREHKADIARYVIENANKIQDDINKMIDYGEEIYSGKQLRDGKKVNITVFVKDCWIVLCDKAKNIVITLYKVDLGLDDEFSKIYVSRMVEKLNAAKKNLDEVMEEIRNENGDYNDLIKQNEELINDYRSKIKQLQELNEAYMEVSSKNMVKYDLAEEKVLETINKLIGKKEF